MFLPTKKQYPYISKFQAIYQDIIKDSKNIPIPQELAKDIFFKFKNNTQIMYSKDELKKLNSSYNNFSKDQYYTLYVIITDKINFYKNLKRYQHYLINTTLQEIFEDYKITHGAYLKITIGGILILNYQSLNNNIQLLNNVIKHELTHYFESNQNYQSFQSDLLPKNPNQLQQKIGILLISLLQYNMTYNNLYYLTSAKQFEAYCTSLETNKHLLKKDILKDLSNKIFNGDILNQPPKLRNLYLFIFLNLQLDKSKQRINYIKQHIFH